MSEWNCKFQCNACERDQMAWATMANQTTAFPECLEGEYGCVCPLPVKPSAQINSVGQSMAPWSVWWQRAIDSLVREVSE